MGKAGFARHILRTLQHNKPITVQNSLFSDGRKEVLSSKTRGLLHWYNCGPTVYDDAHLGHARASVSLDIIRRVIGSLTGTTVNYALGITDIDDKIVKRSAERNESPRDLARRFETRFFEDMHALNVLPPSSILRVTEHIQELQHLINDLVQKNSAYVTKTGNVYFSVSSSGHRYAQLDESRRLCLHSSFAEATPDPGSEKQDARDFALWKRDEHSGQRWESLWGTGRPGWHVECSAMAMAAMGRHLDLHAGGIDLRFPHHTNELAMAEACLGIQTAPLTEDRAGERWSHSWLHVGHLRISGKKMSKSVKNFITVREFFKNSGTADGFRLFCLLHKYSSPIEYSDERLSDAHSYLSRVRTFVNRGALLQSLQHNQPPFHGTSMHPGCQVASELREKTQTAAMAIEDALADDFDTPRVMSQIAQLVRLANSSLSGEGLPSSGAAALAFEQAKRLVQQTLSMLGVSREALSEDTVGELSTTKDMESLTDLVVLFRAAVRDAARRKDMRSVFELCDSTRDELRQAFRIRIADKKDGTSSWVRD